MAINFGLAEQPSNNVMALFEAGQRAAQQRQQQQMRQQVGQQAASGDYAAATSTALAGGDFDAAKAIGGLDDGARKRAASEATVMAAAAARLKALPQDQRGIALQQIAPALMAQGFSQDEIAQADLSDSGLDGYVSIGKAFLDNTDAQEEPSVIRSLRAIGIDPQSEAGRDIVTRSLSAPRYLPNGDGTFTVVGGGGMTQPGPAAPPPSGGDSLEAQAQAAIAAGADPAAVRARMAQLKGGASPQGGATFP